MNELVVAPHPDDEVLGVGGTIARYTAGGDSVFVGVLTRGDAAIFPPEQIDQVRSEARAAHQELGVTGTYFNDSLPAPGMDTVARHEIAAVIGLWLREVEATVLYLPHRGDVHIDHRLAFEAGLVAARPGYSSVKRVLAYETLSETEWGAPTPQDAFMPNVFIDISDFLDVKVRAMQCFGSQIKAFPNPRSAEAIESLARVRGSTVQVRAAEAFSLVREICA